MNQKVQEMDGMNQQLTGGYATVLGYHFAVPPCTLGSCEHQDLGALAAALEKSPVSVCVNAENWKDYTVGVMTIEGCGPMDAASQDHCVMAVGFNTKAPTPYWVSEPSPPVPSMCAVCNSKAHTPYFTERVQTTYTYAAHTPHALLLVALSVFRLFATHGPPHGARTVPLSTTS